MNATELDLGPRAPDWRLVRWDLFIFPEIRDVLATGRDGIVVVIHHGPARVEQWVSQLRSAGLLSP